MGGALGGEMGWGLGGGGDGTAVCGGGGWMEWLERKGLLSLWIELVDRWWDLGEEWRKGWEK